MRDHACNFGKMQSVHILKLMTWVKNLYQADEVKFLASTFPNLEVYVNLPEPPM